MDQHLDESVDNSGQSCNAPTRMLVPASKHVEAVAIANDKREIEILKKCENTNIVAYYGTVTKADPAGREAGEVSGVDRAGAETGRLPHALTHAAKTCRPRARPWTRFFVANQARKTRQLWMYENVRIHLDEVAGLGTFVEFESTGTVISSRATGTVAISGALRAEWWRTGRCSAPVTTSPTSSTPRSPTCAAA